MDEMHEFYVWKNKNTGRYLSDFGIDPVYKSKRYIDTENLNSAVKYNFPNQAADLFGFWRVSVLRGTHTIVLIEDDYDLVEVTIKINVTEIKV